MRISSGSLRGRIFDAPKGHHTHPMGDRVRGGLFNTLGDLGGLTVLDAFAGSGALSFEAISRGAHSAIAIEKDRAAQNVVAKNILALDLSEQVKLIKAPAAAWCKTATERFDVVLLDPPYDDLQNKLLVKLVDYAKSGGTVAISLPPKASFQLPSPKFALLTTKSYGDARLDFYRCTT